MCECSSISVGGGSWYRWSARPAWVVALILGLGSVLASCDGDGGGSPTSPGSALTLVASGNQIGRFDATTLTADVRRSDGQPAGAGVEVRFATTLGTIAPTSLTDSGGRARANLQGDGRTGTARVTASLASGASATLEVRVVPGLLVSLASDAVGIPLQGSTGLTATVRESNGVAAPAGIVVRLETDLGRVDPGSAVTENGGMASAVLHGTGVAGAARVTATVEGAERVAEVTVAIGQGIVLAIDANPLTIPPNGSSQITVRAFGPDGSPANGTRVELSTTLGRLDDSGPVVDALGLARTTLRGDGRTGDARIVAHVDGAVADVEVVVAIR